MTVLEILRNECVDSYITLREVSLAVVFYYTTLTKLKTSNPMINHIHLIPFYLKRKDTGGIFSSQE